MIEFIPFGLLAGVPIGFGCFALARRKGRTAWVWGLSMGVLATLWLAGAAAIPSMAGGHMAAAVPVVLLTAASLLVQVVLAISLLTTPAAGSADTGVRTRRIVILLVVMCAVLALSVIVAMIV